MTTTAPAETVIAHDEFTRLYHDGERIIVESRAYLEPMGLGYGSKLEPAATTRSAALAYARGGLDQWGATLGEFLGQVHYGTETRRAWVVVAAATHPDDLDALMGLDCLPLRVLPGGVTVEARDVYSPDLAHVEGAPAGEDVEGIPDGWALLSGYSGQDRYAGPVMHASETIGGRMADDILSTPGVYTATTVEVYPTDDEPDPFPAGWAVARRLDA